jgi:hypothetical protein
MVFQTAKKRFAAKIAASQISATYFILRRAFRGQADIQSARLPCMTFV